MVSVGNTLLLVVTAAATGMLSFAATPNPEEIIRKSITATKADWAEAPKYSYLDRDVESKRHDPRMSKTYRVLMIDGTPYNFVTAIDDRPLSSEEKAAEQRKMQRAREKRQNESERERQRRIEKYRKDSERNHEMLQEMVDAFQFHVSGEAEVNGHACWVLDAAPKPGYEPSDHEGRVLKGMKGRLWIDKASYQWVKVHAEVVKTGQFLRISRESRARNRVRFGAEPVAGDIWMPKVFNVRVRASALGFFNEDSEETRHLSGLSTDAPGLGAATIHSVAQRVWRARINGARNLPEPHSVLRELLSRN